MTAETNKARVRTQAGARISDDSLRQFSGYHLKRAFNAMQTDLNQSLKPLGLRMVTYSVLSVIVENPGLRQSHLADVLSVERPNLVVILDDLERQDLIVRERVPTDRRAYSLLVTLAGRALYEKALAATKEHEARLFGDLDDQTRATFLSVLEKLWLPRVQL